MITILILLFAVAVIVSVVVRPRRPVHRDRHDRVAVVVYAVVATTRPWV